MRVLLAGATGVIGTPLVPRLRKAGYTAPQPEWLPVLAQALRGGPPAAAEMLPRRTCERSRAR